MLNAAGIAIILYACMMYGNMLTKRAEEKIMVIEALCSFVMYIKTSIKTARIPLDSIYSSFQNDFLGNIGFDKILCGDGLYQAIFTLKEMLSGEVWQAMIYLEKNLGGIDIDSQTAVCTYVEEVLHSELENVKNAFNNKKKMYRMLPLLAGLSVIILIV